MSTGILNGAPAGFAVDDEFVGGGSEGVDGGLGQQRVGQMASS